MITFTTQWFDQRIPQFEKFLLPLKGKENLLFLEIGCFEGKSALWMMKNVLTGDKCQLVCVDPFDLPKHYATIDIDVTGDALYERFKENLMPYSDRIIISRQKSQIAIRDLKMDTFDFIYIDGSHTASDVLEDAVISWRLLKTGGIMAFDDYYWNPFSKPIGKPYNEDGLLQEPRLGIDGFTNCFRTQYELLNEGEQTWIRKL